MKLNNNIETELIEMYARHKQYSRIQGGFD
jgi:hypothetical protein